MPDPVTPDSIAEAAAAPASASNDFGSASAHPIPDQIAAHQYAAAQEAVEETNAYGGSRSGWNMTRPAKAIPPGAVGRT
jgi:hypothetical protein